MKNINTILLTIILLSCASVKTERIQIEIVTDVGSIVADLYPDLAPITASNFLKYIENNKFEGAHFYRVVRMDNQPDNEVKIEVIQGGLGIDDEEDSPYKPIPHETTDKTGILHTDGVLSMARLEPGTASSEFFITIGNQPDLDFGGQRNKDGQGFATFGKVVEGMEVVKNIQNFKEKDQMLIDKIKILSIKIIE